MKNITKFFILVICLHFDLLHATQFADSKLLADKDRIYSKSIGISDAKAHLRLDSIVLLVIGGERCDWKHKIRLEEYKKFGIDWRWTGDDTSREFEQYRDGFNEVMEKAITIRFGKNTIKIIEGEIKRREMLPISNLQNQNGCK